MGRARRIAAALLAVVTLGSVVASVPVHPSEPPANGLWGVDPMVLVAPAKPDVLLLASTDAKLVYLAREHCLVLADRDYDGPLTVDTTAVPPALARLWGGAIWPYGTTPIHDGDRIGLNIPGVGDVLLGQQLQIGGGTAFEEDSAAIAKYVPWYPRACYGGLYYAQDVRRLGPAQ